MSKIVDVVAGCEGSPNVKLEGYFTVVRAIS